MPTDPTTSERESPCPDGDSLRQAAQRLFSLVDEPPYTRLVGEIPAVLGSLESVRSSLETQSRPDAIDALKACEAAAMAALSLGSLDDQGLISLAEQFDRLVAVCESAHTRTVHSLESAERALTPDSPEPWTPPPTPASVTIHLATESSTHELSEVAADVISDAISEEPSQLLVDSVENEHDSGITPTDCCEPSDLSPSNDPLEDESSPDSATESLAAEDRMDHDVAPKGGERNVSTADIRPWVTEDVPLAGYDRVPEGTVSLGSEPALEPPTSPKAVEAASPRPEETIPGLEELCAAINALNAAPSHVPDASNSLSPMAVHTFEDNPDTGTVLSAQLEESIADVAPESTACAPDVSDITQDFQAIAASIEAVDTASVDPVPIADTSPSELLRVDEPSAADHDSSVGAVTAFETDEPASGQGDARNDTTGDQLTAKPFATGELEGTPKATDLPQSEGDSAPAEHAVTQSPELADTLIEPSASDSESGATPTLPGEQPSPGLPAASSSLDDLLELDSLSGMQAALGVTSSPNSPAGNVTSASDGVDPLWAQLGVEPLEGDAFSQPMSLSESQQQLLTYMIADMPNAAASLLHAVERLLDGDADGAAQELTDVSASTERTAVFFGYRTLIGSAHLVATIAAALGECSADARNEFADVLCTVGEVWSRCGDALSRCVEQHWPLARLIDRVNAATAQASNSTADPLAETPPDASPIEVPQSDDSELEISVDQVQQLAGSDEITTWGSSPLTLAPEKAALLQFLVNDVKQAADSLTPLVPRLNDLGSRDEVCSELRAIGNAMAKATAEFEFRSLKELIVLVGDVAAGLHGVTDAMVPELAVRVLAIQSLIQQHGTALEVGMDTVWPLRTFTNRIHRMLEGNSVARPLVGLHGGNTERVIEIDMIVDWGEPTPKIDPAEDQSAWERPTSGVNATSAPREDIIRIEAGVIDGLLNTVGELVQQRGRLQMMCDQLRKELRGNARIDEVCRSAEVLERSMVKLQTGLMSTRLQPLSRLFDNYPRVIRDVARIADREVDVKISGAETLVDKSILEGLAEPLMSILRFAASRDIETPAQREACGKPKVGTLHLSARHQGSQILITIEDDGAGFDRAETVDWVIKAGLMMREQAEALGDDELAALTLESDVTCSPLCRVARLLQDHLGAVCVISSRPGKGVHLDLIIPMKSTILAAVLVAAGHSQYTVPLQAIVEITRLDPDMIKTIGGSSCMRLRGDVFPLLDARRMLGDETVGEPAFALVLTTGETHAAIGVDRVISKQDMIIKQIEDPELRRGPFSGTTLTQDGRVSLVLDVQRVLSSTAETRS